MFSLIWKRTANRAVIRLWAAANAAKRQSLASALQRIILELSADPEQAGESRDRGRRIMTAAPIGIIFKVDAVRLRVHSARLGILKR